MTKSHSVRVQLANSILQPEKWEAKNIHEIQKARTMKEAAYRAVRATHEFLTDTNHTWTGGQKSFWWGGKKVVFNSITIHRNKESPPILRIGFGADLVDYWFAVEYRRAPEAPLARQAA
jgi:hypothetical protein